MFPILFCGCWDHFLEYIPNWCFAFTLQVASLYIISKSQIDDSILTLVSFHAGFLCENKDARDPWLVTTMNFLSNRYGLKWVILKSILNTYFSSSNWLIAFMFIQIFASVSKRQIFDYLSYPCDSTAPNCAVT